MKAPDSKLISLYNMSVIYDMKVSYLQTGTDTADTFVTMRGVQARRPVRYKWSDIKEFLEVEVGFNYVARLKDRYSREVSEWLDFVEANEQDMKEYQRLKKIFEGVNMKENKKFMLAFIVILILSAIIIKLIVDNADFIDNFQLSSSWVYQMQEFIRPRNM